MAKVVQTTAEQVLKAARDFPKAEGLLKDLFPEAFAFEFKAGNIVGYTAGHNDGPFIVVGYKVNEALNQFYMKLSDDSVRLISLNSGLTYSPLKTALYLIKEKY